MAQLYRRLVETENFEQVTYIVALLERFLQKAKDRFRVGRVSVEPTALHDQLQKSCEGTDTPNNGGSEGEQAVQRRPLPDSKPVTSLQNNVLPGKSSEESLVREEHSSRRDTSAPMAQEGEKQRRAVAVDSITGTSRAEGHRGADNSNGRCSAAENAEVPEGSDKVLVVFPAPAKEPENRPLAEIDSNQLLAKEAQRKPGDLKDTQRQPGEAEWPEKTGKTADKAGNGKKGKRNEELLPIKMALTENVLVQDMTVRRDLFCTKLQDMRISVRKNFATEEARFSLEEAITLTNFFFGEMMGPHAHQRLIKLLKFYQTPGEDDIDVGAAARAKLLAKDVQKPEKVRDFFASFGTAQQEKVNSMSNYASFTRMLTMMELYRNWSALRDAATGREKEVVELLHSRGYKPTKGRNYRNLVNEFLTAELELSSTDKLINDCQVGMGISGLADEFSEGVVLLLPAGAGSRYVNPKGGLSD